MKVTSALVLLVAFSYVSSETANFYCGRRLANVLASLCWNEEPEKRNAGRWLAPANHNVGRWLAPAKQDAARWIPAEAGGRSLAGTRGKRGPVDECCYKPCTVDELMTYC